MDLAVNIDIQISYVWPPWPAIRGDRPNPLAPDNGANVWKKIFLRPCMRHCEASQIADIRRYSPFWATETTKDKQLASLSLFRTRIEIFLSTHLHLVWAPLRGTNPLWHRGSQVRFFSMWGTGVAQHRNLGSLQPWSWKLLLQFVWSCVRFRGIASNFLGTPLWTTQISEIGSSVDNIIANPDPGGWGEEVWHTQSTWRWCEKRDTRCCPTGWVVTLRTDSAADVAHCREERTQGGSIRCTNVSIHCFSSFAVQCCAASCPKWTGQCCYVKNSQFHPWNCCAVSAMCLMWVKAYWHVLLSIEFPIWKGLI